MRAAILRKNGPTDSVEIAEIDPPKPGNGELLVRVNAAAVNPADVKVCTGKDGGAFIHARKFPMAIGFDFSGVVEQAGPKATEKSVGDMVFGHLPYSPFTTQGSFAEYVVVKPDRVAHKPAGVTHEQAAAAATAGCTALQALRDRGRLASGNRVLINGASGGVGSYAVQIARILGAEVWGTASAPKTDFVRGLGASEVVDYRQTPIEKIEQTFDVIFDAAAASSYGETKHLLERGGAYVTTLPSLQFLKGVLSSLPSSKRCTYVTVQSRDRDLDRLGAWIASGELDPSLDATYRLDQVTTALAAMESGQVRGKLALQIG